MTMMVPFSNTTTKKEKKVFIVVIFFVSISSLALCYLHLNGAHTSVCLSVFVCAAVCWLTDGMRGRQYATHLHSTPNPNTIYLPVAHAYKSAESHANRRFNQSKVARIRSTR